MSTKQSIKELFQFTKSERRGIVVLMILLAIVITWRIAFPYFSPPDSSSEVRIKYIELKTPKAEPAIEIPQVKAKESIAERKIDRQTKIDPNKASFDELMNVGFSEFSANNIIKYRLSGGEFSSAHDLSIIYGVDSQFIAAIEHQVVIEKIRPAATVIKASIMPVELNGSDTTLLKSLPCIGSVLSSRIVKYRNMLGGFFEKKQLLEVYGIDEICYENIAERIHVDATQIKKINLNTGTEKELLKHPYITKYQARAIVKYRELMGAFTDLEVLTDNYILTLPEYKRVQSYLEL